MMLLQVGVGPGLTRELGVEIGPWAKGQNWVGTVHSPPGRMIKKQVFELDNGSPVDLLF